MAPGRVTRSNNQSVPRKRYDIDADSVYEPETAASAKVSSDEDATDDTIPAMVTPRSKAKKTPKRKQPATPANRKGKVPAKPSPTKKPRNGMREPTPRTNYASMFVGDFGKNPEVELPNLPRSTYAPSEMEEWSQFSNRMVDVLGERMNGNVDYEAGEPSSPSGNQSALAVVQRTLREKQAEVSTRVPEFAQSRSAPSREGSIVWMDTSVMGQRESVRPPSSWNQAQPREPEQSELGDQLLAEPNPRGASLAFEQWMGVVDQQSQVNSERGGGQSHVGDDHVSDENDFNVNFDDEHSPPQDVYDVEDGTVLGHAAPGEEGGVPDREDQEQDDDLLPVEDIISNGELVPRREASDGARPPEGYEVEQPREEVRSFDQPAGVGKGRAQEYIVASEHFEAEADERPVQQQAVPAESLYVEPAEDIVRAVIKSRLLNLILGKFNTEAWTAEGSKWEAEVLDGFRKHLSSLDRDEINKERRNAGRVPLPSGPLTHAIMWYAHHRDEVSSDKAREMLQCIYRTWQICREAPKAAELDAQVHYFTRGEGQGFRANMKLCQSYVRYICKRLPAGEEARRMKARRMRQSLCRRVIPLMAVLLKEVFMLASTRAKPKDLGTVQELPEEVEATEFHLHTLFAVTKWLQQLSQAMMADYEVNPPDDLPSNWDTRQKQRASISPHLKGFRDIIQHAIKYRNETIDEPARKVRARESDRQEIARKQDRLRQERKAQQHQYQLFRASLQTPSQLKRPRQAPSPASTFFLSQPLPKRKKTSPKEQYALENKGWYWDEDDTLMNALRRVSSPLASGLVHALPGRDEHQVKRRLMELREIGRKHYEAKGMDPPKWCRGYGWR